MASNITRDHHNLRRNLKLNGNYLSNDGGDEGISIADDGDITLTSNDTQLKIAYDATNYASFTTADDGALTVTTVDADAEEADIILVPNGEVKIDRNTLSNGVGATTKGLEIDYDHTSTTANAQTMIGLDIDTRSTATTGGEQTLYGAKLYSTLSAASGSGLCDAYGLYSEVVGNQVALTDAATAGYFKASGTDTNTGVWINCEDGANDLFIQSSASSNDWFKIQVGALGATIFTTQDYGGSDYEADLTLNIDGKIDMNSASGENIILDSGGGIILEADGHVEFDGCAVGFDKEIAAFSTSPIDSDANDSTDVDFRLGNKFELTLTDDISGTSEYINLIFPAVSGNFILVLIQGVADCTVAAAGWQAYQSDGSTKATNNAGNDQADGRVRWAGGSAPTLSTSQYDVDIISFYWDADDQTAFAVASLDF